jgi:hypothetical protein
MKDAPWSIVKKASVIGLIAGELLMLWVFLAPFSKHPALPARMVVPKEMIPQAAPEDMGKPVPWDVQVVRLAVGAVFFGPFGAFVGLGFGLLIQGGVDILKRHSGSGALNVTSRG